MKYDKFFHMQSE